MCFNVCAEVQVKNRRDCWSLEQNYTDLWGTQCGYWEPHSGLCKSSRFSLLWELLFSPNLYTTIFKILFMFIYVSLDSCVSELHTYPLGSEESLGSPSPHSVFYHLGSCFLRKAEIQQTPVTALSLNPHGWITGTWYDAQYVWWVLRSELWSSWFCTKCSKQLRY